MERFKSRKFLLTLGVCFTAIGSALTGEVMWADAVHTILIAVLGYLGVEGAADVISRMKEK